MFTNIDGLVLSLLELKDYLKNNKPVVVCLTEIKLKEEIKLRFAKEGYSTQRRDRKGMGVMILVKEDIVEEVEYGDGMAETLSVMIKIKKSEKRKVIVTYIPPKTNTWETNRYKIMQLETGNSIEKMIKKSKLLLVGDFSTKEINWEEMEVKKMGHGVKNLCKPRW